MKRRLLSLLLPFAAALCAFAVHAQEAQKPEPAPDSKIMQQIFNCIAEGLPQDWKKAWFVITETRRNADGSARRFRASFFVATSVTDRKGKPLRPCGSEPVIEGVRALTDLLPEEQRRWTEATLSFTNDGKFEAKFDVTPRKPAAVKPAPKPAGKKSDPGGKT